MPGSAESNIYNRLISAPLHHPASAGLFVNDWTLETGDVVSLVSDTRVYDMPIYSMDYTWFGGPTAEGGNEGKAEIQATGNQEREPLSELKRKRYASGSGAYRAQKEDLARFIDNEEMVGMIASDLQGLDASLTLTASQIRAEVSDSNNLLSSAITQTASQIRSEVSNTASGLHSQITQTASQIRSEVSDSVSGLHSQITQTASSIRSEVASSISNAYNSIIEQTDSHIRSEVSSAVSGIYTSVIEQTGSYIRTEIQAAASDITSSVIEQTGSYIRTEIANASSELAGSVIEQTESYIRFIVADRSRVIAQWENPATIPGEEIHEGDVWVKTNGITTWNEFGELAWEDGATFNWEDYLGNRTLIYHNGAWVETASAIQQELNRQGIELSQEQIKVVKADTEGNKALIQVTASQLRSQITDTRAGLTSTIQQTASQIRLEVDDKTSPARIVLGINSQEGSYVKIRADKINLTGYTTVSELEAAKARIEDLEGDTARFNSLMAGTTTAAYLKASTMVASGSFTFKGHSLGFYQMTDIEGRTRYLLGHA